MLLTISLVILVIFLFLRTLWATIIPSLAVPLSLLATFAVMYAAGYSLDNISLMALTISVGFIVDDAIVMIENIVRYIEQGMRPFDAALKGAGQIGFTIISITFSLIAVFIPLFFMGGIIGRLVPRICRHRIGGGRCFGSDLADADAGLVLAVFKGAGAASHGPLQPRRRSASFNWLLRRYDRGLEFVFRHQFVTLLSTLALIVVDRVSLCEDPKGIFPAAGYRVHLWRGRHSRRRFDDPRPTRSGASDRRHRQAGSGRRRGFSRLPAPRLQPGRKYRPDVHAAEAAMTNATPTADQIIQRLRPKVAGVEGVKFFMQVRAGHHGRRPLSAARNTNTR